MSMNTKLFRGFVWTAIVTAITLSANGSSAKAQDQTAPMIDPNRVVMVINGEEIKGAEYYRRMEFLQDVGSVVGNTFIQFPPGFLTIKKLIDERLSFALAKDKGVYPSDEEVDAEIKLRLQDKPKMLEEWMASGGNLDELKYSLRFQIAEFKLQTFGITVTDTEVEDFYKTHPEIYTSPLELKLRMIAVASSEDTKAVDDQLAAGKDFATVAKEKSIDVSKVIGGEYGTIEEYKLDTATREALNGVKIGQTTKWLTTAQNGGTGTYLKFLKEDVIPAKKYDLDSRLRRIIRRTLMLDRGRVKNAGMVKEKDLLRSKIKIEIKQAEFADAYQKYLANYLKQKGIN